MSAPRQLLEMSDGDKEVSRLYEMGVGIYLSGVGCVLARFATDVAALLCI